MQTVVSYNIQAKITGPNLLNSNYYINKSEDYFEIYNEDNSIGRYSSLASARRAIVEYVYTHGATRISFTQI